MVKKEIEKEGVGGIESTDFAVNVATLHDLIREASPSQALTICNEFIHGNPKSSEGYFFASLVCKRLGQMGLAIQMMTQAHDLEPAVREYALALSTLFANAGKLADALYFAKIGAANEPNEILDCVLPEDMRDFIAATLSAEPQKHFVQAMRAYNVRNFALAIQECEQELQSNQRFAPAYFLLGRSLLGKGHYERAVMALSAALQIGEDVKLDEVRICLAEAYLRLGGMVEARNILTPLLEAEECDVGTLAGVTSLLALVPRGAWSQAADFCERWTKKHLEHKEPFFPPVPRQSERIRVGFLTDKAYDCLEGRILEVFAKRYDRRLFDCFLYHQNIHRDNLTHGFVGTMTVSRDVYEIDDKTFAYIIRNDDIDILVDMCGYGPGQRLSLIAHKPARAHVSWLVLPVVDKQPGIEWSFRDMPSDPDHSVPLVARPLALESLTGYAVVSQPPVLRNGAVTFGARLDLSYLTLEIAEIWGRLIVALPGTRLRFGLINEISQSQVDRLAELFSSLNALDRVTLHVPEGGVETLGSFFSDVDIFLGQPTGDTVKDFIDAMWCGVPCVSLPPDRKAFVTGRDIVSMCGMDKCNADDVDGFIAQATALALDVAGLAEMRRSLRDKVRGSGLLDGEGFARALQGALVSVANTLRAQEERESL